MIVLYWIYGINLIIGIVGCVIFYLNLKNVINKNKLKEECDSIICYFILSFIPIFNMLTTILLCMRLCNWISSSIGNIFINFIFNKRRWVNDKS